ncbi:MAG: response regulator transcription factor, partial [Spirochaetales bacterium]|nr:response regulator transcription factor [Spirochaetales bacterium]
VQLICEGYTNKEIAQELSISVNTVNNHVANIFSKMGVRSRIDLLKALKEGPWS